MTRRFAIGFTIGLLAFILINLFSTHLSSDCGPPAVFDAMPALILPVPLAFLAGVLGWLYRPHKICTGLISLCYNAAIMQYQLCFANNNNNNDNDDPRIVGRSFAG